MRTSSSLNFGEILAALSITGAGAYILWEARGYNLGTPAQMGPGFFPVGVGSFLVIIGLVLVFEAVRTPKTEIDISLRAVVAIMAALISFSVLLPILGLVPATIALVVLSLMAEGVRGWKLTLGLCVALAAIGYFVFVLGFRIPLNPFWW